MSSHWKGDRGKCFARIWQESPGADHFRGGCRFEGSLAKTAQMVISKSRARSKRADGIISCYETIRLLRARLSPGKLANRCLPLILAPIIFAFQPKTSMTKDCPRRNCHGQ